MNENKEKAKYVNIQLIATLGFVGALLISFALGYDKKLSLENKERLFSSDEAQKIAEFQSTLVVIISLVFVYVNYNQYKISKKYNDSDKDELLVQEVIATVSLIAAIIGIFITFSHRKNNSELSISEIEVL